MQNSFEQELTLFFAEKDARVLATTLHYSKLYFVGTAVHAKNPIFLLIITL